MARARLVTNSFVFVHRQGGLRTPTPATLLPVNMSTIAKPHTPENGDRREYSPATNLLHVDPPNKHDVVDVHDQYFEGTDREGQGGGYSRMSPGPHSSNAGLGYRKKWSTAYSQNSDEGAGSHWYESRARANRRPPELREVWDGHQDMVYFSKVSSISASLN
jgi:hypothetical protein